MRYSQHTLISFDGEQSSTYFMRADGKSFCRVYFFLDKPKEGILDNLSVHESIRKRGEGTKLQQMREAWLRRRGFKYVFLWVKQGSWMAAWYVRRGYKFFAKHKRYKGCIWMKKKL